MADDGNLLGRETSGGIVAEHCLWTEVARIGVLDDAVVDAIETITLCEGFHVDEGFPRRWGMKSDDLLEPVIDYVRSPSKVGNYIWVLKRRSAVVTIIGAHSGKSVLCPVGKIFISDTPVNAPIPGSYKTATPLFWEPQLERYAGPV